MSFMDFLNKVRKNPKGVLTSPEASVLTGGLAPKAYAIGKVTADQFGSAFDRQIQGMQTNQPGDPGAGTATSDPAADLRNQVQSKFQALQSVWNDLYGSVDNVIKERANQLNQNYDTQINDVNKAYASGAERTGNIYGARGLGSSSYATNAQDELKGDYERQLGDLNRSREGQLAELGQYGATTKAGFDASKNAYSDAMGQLGNYDASGLSSLLSQLGSALTGAQQTAAGLGTNQDFIGKLNQITPVQQQFTNQLQTKLQNLVTSSAPVYAKKQIAQGLIRSANLTDPNAQAYWNDFFAKALSGAGMA